ncbi:DUF4351 domain-containing protein [Oceanirhabdus seepicola]|uniref:DUF4351 domain-containing protein n=1 Tax=Oceanirhabdus seepicola TaxID=2828781 RepID=A0A9J6NYW6_9CLOT|nr:DUF4351 domain-containing protein [Oceanirhabdus seepicola]MCM1988813.1 DUF4351 domain-containing protein [Oceanirhabdus seepicola]
MVYSIAKYSNLVKEDSEEVYGQDSVGKLQDTSSYLQMDKIMKKLFSIHNKKPIIDFLNAIYKDNISYDAEINYRNKEFINLHKYKTVYYSHYADMYVKVEDGQNIYEYEIEFQTVHDEKMAIRLFRYGFEKAVEKADFSKLNEIITIRLPEPFLIVLEEGKGIPDEVKLKLEIPKQGEFIYKSKVLKYWRYDIEMLYNENMYLLYPLQIFKLRKSMKEISRSRKSQEEKRIKMDKIHNQMLRMTRETLVAMSKAYDEGKLELNDFDTMNTIIENLISYFNDKYTKYINIEMEVKDMVKSFYDPKVEERGIQKGIKKGIQKEKEEARLKDVELVIKLLTKKFGEIDRYVKDKISKASYENLSIIIENILDIESLEEAMGYISDNKK